RTVSNPSPRQHSAHCIFCLKESLVAENCQQSKPSSALSTLYILFERVTCGRELSAIQALVSTQHTVYFV
ncbi:hypothetical protein BgiMline_005587, partial [Biomphalaria glabrata]